MLPLLLASLAGIPIDRDLEVLPKEPRAALLAAGRALGDRKLVIATYELDGRTLEAIAKEEDEPLLRAVRERLHRPIDLEDFLLFLDDVLAAKGSRGTVFIPADRARKHGILVHPEDVFGKKKGKVYAEKDRTIAVDDPPLQEGLEPAKDFDPPGPRWTARYQQPATFEQRLIELELNNPEFGKKMRSLIGQLAAQGATIIVESAVRSRARGYLMFGAYYLSRSGGRADLRKRIARLKTYNESWGLAVPITWEHPDGFAATVEAARQMSNTYGVDYATVGGARNSDHYDGKAIDLVALDLPRRLELTAPGGVRASFDLSHPEQTRDLSLTPELIDWIEAHFQVKKLRSDYPHWMDPG